MTEPELNAEIARKMFGLAKPERTDEPTAAGEQPPAAGEPAVELTDDERELARRYGLSPQDVKRVRGETWAERCQDAARLASPEPRPTPEEPRSPTDDLNTNVLGLFAAKAERDRALVELIHPPPTEGKGGQ